MPIVVHKYTQTKLAQIHTCDRSSPISYFTPLSPSLAEILHPPRPSTICGGADHADPTRNHPRNTRARVQEEVGHERGPVPTNLSTVV